MIYYVIPCREQSMGVPNKNRFLWDYTVSKIPMDLYSNIIVTTDDECLLKKANALSMKTIERSTELSSEHAPIKPVIGDIVDSCGLNSDDDIVVLYLTYPDRTWEDVEKVLSFYQEKKAKSLLCARVIQAHPFLCFYKRPDNKGEPIVRHNLYRRQDYPDCFALSHFVSVLRVSEIDNLNDNLYNIDTVFYPIDKEPIDIDTQKDLEQLERLL